MFPFRYEAALFQQQAVQILAEKGDVKLSTAMLTDVIQLYERGISGLMKDSQVCLLIQKVI